MTGGFLRHVLTVVCSDDGIRHVHASAHSCCRPRSIAFPGLHPTRSSLPRDPATPACFDNPVEGHLIGGGLCTIQYTSPASKHGACAHCGHSPHMAASTCDPADKGRIVHQCPRAESPWDEQRGQGVSLAVFSWLCCSLDVCLDSGPTAGSSPLFEANRADLVEKLRAWGLHAQLCSNGVGRLEKLEGAKDIKHLKIREE
mmetsp:Transcript_37358/g.107665  ORF Transcript_37358/g.107665 Transcript_37358/m.107665 type:complete len:200 (+) Transcript_37358:315-914(+)